MLLQCLENVRRKRLAKTSGKFCVLPSRSMVSGLDESKGKVRMDQADVLLRPQGRSVMGYCLLDFALPSQDLPQVMMSVEVARLVLQRLLVMRSRLFELPLLCENVGQVVASDRVFGTNVQRISILSYRFIELSLIVQHVAESDQGWGVAQVYVQSLAVLIPGLG